MGAQAHLPLRVKGLESPNSLVPKLGTDYIGMEGKLRVCYVLIGVRIYDAAERGDQWPHVCGLAPTLLPSLPELEVALKLRRGRFLL